MDISGSRPCSGGLTADTAVDSLLLNDLERQVLSAIGGEATPIDQIVADTGLTVPQVLSTLSVLEMRRLVRRLSGTTVARP